MKKILAVVFIFIGLLSTTSFSYIDTIKSEIEPSAKTAEPYKFNPLEDSKDKLCNDILVSFLSRYTQEAVSNYYSKYLKNIPSADPLFDKVISVERLPGEKGQIRHDYLITIETSPYLGAHNSVGIDHVTFRINALGDVSLEKFEHIKSYEIPPWLR